MPLDFPNSPANNATYTSGSTTWTWANNYGYWAIAPGPLGYTGSSGAFSATGYAGSSGYTGSSGAYAAVGFTGSTGGVTTGKSIAMAIVFGG